MAQPKPVFARIENSTEGEDVGATVEKALKNKERIPVTQEVAEA